jgi:hypothetical protein
MAKLTAHTLYSGVLVTGSKAALVSRLAAFSAKCSGMNTPPGLTRPVTKALTMMLPRRLVALTSSPGWMCRRPFVGRSGFRRQGADDLPIQHL